MQHAVWSSSGNQFWTAVTVMKQFKPVYSPLETVLFNSSRENSTFEQFCIGISDPSMRMPFFH